MDEELDIVFEPEPTDPIATATNCLIALAQAVDTTDHYKARRFLIRMMESIVIYTAPPKAVLIPFTGGLSDTSIN